MRKLGSRFYGVRKNALSDERAAEIVAEVSEVNERLNLVGFM